MNTTWCPLWNFRMIGFQARKYCCIYILAVTIAVNLKGSLFGRNLIGFKFPFFSRSYDFIAEVIWACTRLCRLLGGIIHLVIQIISSNIPEVPDKARFGGLLLFPVVLDVLYPWRCNFWLLLDQCIN